MKKYFLALALSPLILTACKTDDISKGMAAFDALTLSDEQVVQMSEQSCKMYDSENKVASSKSKYGRRLARITKGLPKKIGNKKITYKVYNTQEVNAFAMQNGCIRVYSGLMDLMNDNEVRGVIAHEIGHVELGHSRKAMQTAALASLGTQAVMDLSGKKGVKVGGNSMSSEEVHKLANALINAQFSQKQEQDADDYAYNLLVSKKRSPAALASAFRKLEQLSNGNNGVMSKVLSSHPQPGKRADRVTAKMAK